MPLPPGQLALIVQLGGRNVAGTPAAVFLVAEHGGPKALKVVARLRVHALHVPQEELLQHSLVEVFGMLVDGFAPHGEDGAGLEADRVRRSVVTEVVEEFFEVLRRRLGGFFPFEDALGR